jgi:cyclohexadienyl dehydratase
MRRLGSALLLVLLVLACLVVACAPAKHEAPARERPTITISAGTSGDYPPLSSWTSGEPEGFAPSLIRAFAADTKRGVVFVRFRWPDLANDLAAKKFEVAADGITVRPERSISGIYTVPIARGGALLLLHREHAQDVQAAGLRIAVNKGGHLEKVTRELFRSAQITTIENNALRDVLVRHEADAVMTNTFEAPRLREGLPDVVAVGPLTHDTTALWVRADREDLATALDDWLVAAEAGGALSTQRARFLGASTPTARPLSALFAATSERLALMPFVAAAKAKAAQPIDDPAQEARVLASTKAEIQKAAAALGRPALPDAMVDEYLRAQFDAAKEIQRKALPVTTANYELDALRAAIGRITRRKARLLVRLDDVDEAAALHEAHVYLEDSGLSPETIARLAAVHARRSASTPTSALLLH